jgi:demethylmenaquinone methyltransferase/2-methoxy-6-polyprenyl-1,4-benzoquinol methylase
MHAARGDVDRSGAAIQEMFAAVAPRYDLLNHLLSAGLDLVWRRRAAAALSLVPGSRVLDLCCGTGDQAVVLQRRGARVLAADFCLPMLSLAEQKYARLNGSRPRGLAGDALAVPVAAGTIAGVTAAFGLRNVADLDAALTEAVRVLEPGGRAALLEFALPSNPLLTGPYLFYFRRILPLVGRMVSPKGSAYTYLPASVEDFPQRQDFVARMLAAGFDTAAWEDLSGGIVCLYTGAKNR